MSFIPRFPTWFHCVPCHRGELFRYQSRVICTSAKTWKSSKCLSSTYVWFLTVQSLWFKKGLQDCVLYILGTVCSNSRVFIMASPFSPPLPLSPSSRLGDLPNWTTLQEIRNFFDLNTNHKSPSLPLVIDYQPKGCYREGRQKMTGLFPKTFGVVKSVDRKDPDIDQIFSECKNLAENEGYEIFAIQVKTETVLTYQKWFSTKKERNLIGSSSLKSFISTVNKRPFWGLCYFCFIYRSYFQMGSGLWLTMNHPSFSDSPILELNRCWTLLLLNGVQKPFLSTLSSEYQQMYDICKWEGSRLCKVWQILEMHRRWWTWCWKRQSNQFRLLRVKSWSCYLWLTLFNISYNIIIQYL